MLTQILLVLVVLVVALLAYAATRSNTLHVERSATIAAPPDAIAAFITDFHLWNRWSPYDGRDPAMTRTFSGAAAGTGAIYEWSGNNNVGQGRVEITDTQPTHITIKLDFVRPFEAHNIASFILQPAGGLTAVTWAMDGCNSYMSKVMGIFINMDNMIGKDFAAGLVNLKGVAEK
ncbi:MAG: polyketide cyclase [Acidobacteria bacterium]|nr:polyketide cyclase [Acidobacteriota bacterium]